MSESKFTPGPWTAVQHGDGIYTWTIQGNDEFEERSLAIVGVGTPNLQRDKANMHLIVAAPRMLAALEKIMETELAIAQEHRVQAEDSEIYCIAEEVIRQARGESEVKK